MLDSPVLWLFMCHIKKQNSNFLRWFGWVFRMSFMI